MKLLILIISSIGYCGLISSWFKIKYTEALLVYILLMVSALYISGILGFLLPGAIFIAAVGIICFIFIAIRVVRKNNLKELFQSQNRSWLWNLMYFPPFIIIYNSFSDNFLFTGHDEFSHWGISTKVIYETDALYQKDSPIAFKSYPPIQQLFQYYWLLFSGWSEKNVIVAQGFFVLSGLLYLTTRLFKTASLFSGITFFAAFASIHYFGYRYSFIFVDPLLAVLFATSLLMAMNEKGLRGVILLSSCLFVLVLTKQIGLVLGFVALGVYFVNNFLQLTSQYPNNKNSLDWKAILPPVGYMFFTTIAIMVAFKSWDWYLQVIKEKPVFSFPTIQSFFQPPLLERLGATVVEFINRLSKPSFAFMNGHVFSLKVTTYFALFLSFIAVALSPKGQKRNYALYFLVVVVGCIGYLGFLLFCYLFFFTDYEGIRLAGFERYAATFHLAWILVAFCMIAAALAQYRNKVAHIFIVTVLLLPVGLAPKTFFRDIIGKEPPLEIVNTRKKTDSLVEIAKKHIKPKEKAYFISQNSKTAGFEKFVFTYLMVPNQTPFWGWSLGSKYYEGDMWTLDKKLKEVLKGYSILVIYFADDKFWKDNGELLNGATPKQMGVYRVIQKNGEVTALEEVSDSAETFPVDLKNSSASTPDLGKKDENEK